MQGIQAAAIGRLAKDPELRRVKGGELAVLNFTLALEGQDDTHQWLRVSVWAERAEELAPKLHKDSEVYVEGRLTLATWTADDGTPRCGLNLSAWRCHILADFRPPRRKPRAKSGAGGRAATAAMAELAGAVDPEFDDDIPF